MNWIITIMCVPVCTRVCVLYFKCMIYDDCFDFDRGETDKLKEKEAFEYRRIHSWIS